LQATNAPTAGQMLYATDTTKTNLYFADAPSGGGGVSAVEDFIPIPSVNRWTALPMEWINVTSGAGRVYGALSADNTSYEDFEATITRRGGMSTNASVLFSVYSRNGTTGTVQIGVGSLTGTKVNLTGTDYDSRQTITNNLQFTVGEREKETFAVWQVTTNANDRETIFCGDVIVVPESL